MQPHTNDTDVSDPSSAIEIRSPTVRDAADIWRLVRDCDVLDTNSCYAYLLVCRDFCDTSLVATSAGQVVGFVAGYVPPGRPDVVFVWQVGVGPRARKQGVAKALLHALVATAARRGIRYLEATVTPSNAASMRLFRSVSEDLNGEFRVTDGFSQDDFGSSEHEPEQAIRIQLTGSSYGDHQPA